MLGAKCKVYYYKLNSIIMVANMVDVQEYDKVPNKVHGNKYWEVLSFVCFGKHAIGHDLCYIWSIPSPTRASHQS